MNADTTYKIRIVDERTDELIQEIEVPWLARLEFQLQNGRGEPVKCTVAKGTHELIIGVEGYGTLTEVGDGTPIAVDAFHHNMPDDFYTFLHPSAGHAMVATWENINVEEPRIHTLAFARLEHYRGDDE